MKTDELMQKELIKSLQDQLKLVSDNNEILKEEKKYFENENKLLKLRIKKILCDFYAKRSERYQPEPGQQDLFDESEAPIPEEAEDIIIKGTAVEGHTRKQYAKRSPLPEELPREEIVHDIAESSKQCHCCEQPLKQIGEEVTEQLKVIPQKIVVEKHIRPKYACKTCEEGVKIAPMPKLFLPKTQATPELAAFTIISKYADHLPLYRQQRIWKRHGVELPDNTLCNWVMLAYEKCKPLNDALKALILKSGYIHADETPVKVINESPDQSPSKKSYMWVYRTGDPDNCAVLYDYQKGRSTECAKEILLNYSGYLQTDMYQAYNFTESIDAIIQIGCMAHARRKFFDIYKSNKTAKKAMVALNYFQKLYAIEKSIKNKSNAERYQIRLEKSTPILDQLQNWLEKSVMQVPQEHAIGKAINYCLNHWPKLTGYLKDGRLNIDNNPAERAIRPFTIGRKNWMFAGSPRGARAGALFFSLIETAKANGVDPSEYLIKLFHRLADFSGEDYTVLLPHAIDLD